MTKKMYALLTAAHNEERYIEKTITSVLEQTVLPVKWIIVSDNSTDSTEHIVRHYSRQYSFIRLVRKKSTEGRHFGSKALAIRLAYAQLKAFKFDFIGNLDADVSFAPTYFQFLLEKFAQNQKLGLAGGIRYDLVNGSFKQVPISPNSVGGPSQVFRRCCFEQIGGYLPLQKGGIDSVAEIMVRMYGWDVVSFPELKVYHYRQTGTANGNKIKSLFNAGIRDYSIGYHPMFEIVRCLPRLKEKPYLLRTLLMLSGYFWAGVSRYERPVSKTLIQFLRAEQKQRLRQYLSLSAVK